MEIVQTNWVKITAEIIWFFNLLFSLKLSDSDENR